ncbi:MAG: TraR/DksA family transcriptional regulator [Deltaproteobacteria bacterium]|nr:MAG: TraR/DksA family transcriptional regulator [Deltaproteobacteria bacterium]
MDDLTADQLAELKRDLEALHDVLEKVLTGNQEDSNPVDLDLPIGRVSRIDAIQQQKMAQANRRTQELRLQQVRAALKAMREDEYGYCRGCDDSIAYQRLKARPETPFCVDCKKRLESRKR